MKKLSACFLLLLSFNTFSQTTTDPYAPVNYFEKGPFKGQLIPNDDRRSIKIIKEDEQSFTVANFVHNKKFSIAIIPKNAVKEVIIQIDYFTSSIPAAHTEARIVLDRPILVKDQNNRDAQTVEVSDMVLSIEAVKSASTPYSLIQGMQNHFAVAYRFISTPDKYKQLVCDDKERTTQYVINFTEAQKNDFLENAVRLSDAEDNKGMYHTWKKNCTTELIRLFDGVLDRSGWTKMKSAANTTGAHYPVLVRSSLKARDLLGEELSEFKEDATVGLTPDVCKK